MRYGMSTVALLCAACACYAPAAMEDVPEVESPGPLPEVEQETRLEDQPLVDELPDWLINIPPEQAAPTADRRPLHEYVQADERVLSSSRMFAVSGGDALRMGAIATHADELRAHLNGMLKLSGKWKYPVNIRLIGNTADAPTPRPIRLSVQMLGQEPSLQIRIFAGGKIDIDKLDTAIITLLLYEYAMRDIQPDALPDYLEIPHWLITGIQQAVFWKLDRADRRLYQNLFNRPEMLEPETILNTPDPDKLDAVSRQYYEVACGVLIMSLLQQKSGVDRLRGLLTEALTQEGKLRDVLAEHFHFRETEGNSLSKWWALQLAAMAQPHAMETLTPLESEQQLAELLLVTAVDKDTNVPYSVSVLDADALQKLPDWKQKVRKCTAQLSELSMHCFPGYRVIVTEYIRALVELTRDAKPDVVQNILAPLKELREAYMRASIRGRDYLDWFEITQLGDTRLAELDAYMESMRRLRRETSGPHTPISRYLDDIEALHTIKEGEALPKRMLPDRRRKRTTRKKP